MTKQISSIVLGMMLTAVTVQAETLSISSANGMPGETVTVSIDLSNLGPNDEFTTVDAGLKITGGTGAAPELVGVTAATDAPYVWQPFSSLEFIPLTNCTDQQCVFGVIGHDVGVTTNLSGQVMDVEISIPATATLGAVFNLDLVEDFSAISNGVSDPPSILPLNTPFRDGTLIIGELPELDCDFDGDLACTETDIDALTAEIATGGNNLALDINRDGIISLADRDDWLSKAANENGWGAPYLLGDANLDGSVDALDLNALGQRWRQNDNQWSHGDFTADGSVNALDLNAMAQNWRAMIPMQPAAATVPEPSALSLVAIAALALLGRRRHHRR